MQKTIRFFKLDNNEYKGWFADVPNHDLEDVLAVNDASSPEPFLAKFVMKNHDVLGEHPKAIYILDIR